MDQELIILYLTLWTMCGGGLAAITALASSRDWDGFRLWFKAYLIVLGGPVFWVVLYCMVTAKLGTKE